MRAETLKGHLDGMLLASLEAGPRHGYAIMEALRAGSGGQFDLPTGTVYPALRRLERAGLVRGHLVKRQRAAPPRLRADARRPARPGRRAGHLAGVLRRRHRPARTRTAAGRRHDRRTAASRRHGPARAADRVLPAEVAAALPGPARARATSSPSCAAGCWTPPTRTAAPGLPARRRRQAAATAEFGDPAPDRRRVPPRTRRRPGPPRSRSPCSSPARWSACCGRPPPGPATSASAPPRPGNGQARRPPRQSPSP